MKTTEQLQQSRTFLLTTHALSTKLSRNRFVVTVLNNAGDPANPDFSNLKVVDMLNPVFFFMPPRGKVIVFGRIKVSISGSPTGLNAYRFYQNSDYSGAWTPAGSGQTTQPLRRGDTTNLFVHFKWATGPFHPSGPWPGSYIPQVTVNARQLIVSELPDGPIANLQPVL